MKKCMVLVMLLGMCGNAFAYNYWQGDESNRWDAPGNWSDGVVPTAGAGASATALVDDTTVFVTSTTILIDAATAATCDRFYVGDGVNDPLLYKVEMTGGTFTAVTGQSHLYIGNWDNSQAEFNLSGGVVTVSDLYLGNDPAGNPTDGPSGVMNMTGGEVSYDHLFSLSAYEGAYGELNMSGGKITYTGGDWRAASMLVGDSDYAVLNMTGGEIDLGIGRLYCPWGTDAQPEIHLDGGVIRAADLFMTGEDDDQLPGSLDIAGGTLILDGEWDASHEWVVAGYITAYGGAGALAFDYDGSKTTITASSLEIIETGGSTDVIEGGANDTYDITLPGLHDGKDASVTVSPGPQLDVGNGVDTPLVLPTFTRVSPSDPNWTTETVTVWAYDDMDPEGDHTGVINHLSSSDDPNFDGMTGQVIVNITDNDGEVVLSKTTASVSEDGAQDQYTIHLEGAVPTTNVVVTITTTAQADVDQSVLTFNGGNYTTPQTVTISAIDDEDDEVSEHQTVFTHAVTGDPLYDGAPVDNMTVTITDNDPAQALLAQWKLDGDLTDASGNGHDGTVVGNHWGDPNYISGAPFGDDPGGQSLDLDGTGTGQGFTVPHDDALKPLREISLCAWLNSDAYLGDPWQNIIRKNDGGTGRYLLEIGETGGIDGLWFGLVTSTGYHEYGASLDPNLLMDSQWHHLAATYDGSAMKIYFDGVEKFSTPVSGTLGGGTQSIDVGQRYLGGNYENIDGALDDVRIYNYGLSPREIQALMSTRAWNPDPTNGASGVPIEKVLGWSAPLGIINPTYNVYADTKFSKVDAVNPSGQVEYESTSQSPTSFDPIPDLDFASDVFWRVDVTDPAGPTTYVGQVWHFTTVVPACVPPLLGDITGPEGQPDCIVDLLDFAALAADWLACNWNAPSLCP